MMTNFREIKCSCGANKPASKVVSFNDGDYYLCDDKKCKQNLELELEKAEFARSFQGKSKQSYDLSLNIILAVGTLAWIFLIGYCIYYLVSK